MMCTDWEMGESYRDLLVWQRSIQMTVALCQLTASFPKEETYGLSTQLRRAGVSVASNIAEGYARTSTGEYKQFLGMARGSNSEVQNAISYRTGVGIRKSTGTRQSRRFVE